MVIYTNGGACEGTARYAAENIGDRYRKDKGPCANHGFELDELDRIMLCCAKGQGK